MSSNLIRPDSFLRRVLLGRRRRQRRRRRADGRGGGPLQALTRPARDACSSAPGWRCCLMRPIWSGSRRGRRAARGRLGADRAQCALGDRLPRRRLRWRLRAERARASLRRGAGRHRSRLRRAPVHRTAPRAAVGGVTVSWASAGLQLVDVSLVDRIGAGGALSCRGETDPPPRHRAASTDSMPCAAVAIVWMAIFHFCFDLNYFGFIHQNFYRDPFWTVQRSCIVTLFLFCAGPARPSRGAAAAAGRASGAAGRRSPAARCW